MTTRTITAIYDSEADARMAREQLMSNGLDDNDVRIVSQNLSSNPVGTDEGSEDKGVWESIKDFFVGDDDRPVYSEGLRRGGYLLTARVDDDLSDQAISVLERTNAVDLDQRSEQWRTEGWSADTYATGTTTSFSDADLPRSDSPTRERMSDEQSIPVVEERLRVGKREVDRGGVRVRSYVVEEPVHEQVSLHEERVEVERRPATGRTAAGRDAFQEQTIELQERGEEAVVAKDAVVKEEVVIRKTGEDRVEEIDETVRRTEVDVDDTRTSGKGGKSSGTSSTRSRR
jgi:uncharacterized protein (TIGR02271 family)